MQRRYSRRMNQPVSRRGRWTALGPVHCDCCIYTQQERGSPPKAPVTSSSQYNRSNKSWAFCFGMVSVAPLCRPERKGEGIELGPKQFANELLFATKTAGGRIAESRQINGDAALVIAVVARMLSSCLAVFVVPNWRTI
jgi:hypothetical protein